MKIIIDHTFSGSSPVCESVQQLNSRRVKVPFESKSSGSSAQIYDIVNKVAVTLSPGDERNDVAIVSI